jgi:uncharacterized damage-inducible protein DinB
VDVSAVLLDLYGRIPPLAREAVEGLSPDQLTKKPGPEANTIAWLIWHLTRVEDHYLAEHFGADELWVTGDWAGRFGLDPDPGNTGYGHSPEEVAAVRPDGPDALLDYLGAVDAGLRKQLEGLTPEELERVVDQNWDPPVTLGVRLISIADDGLQHVGQANYLRGLLGF